MLGNRLERDILDVFDRDFSRLLSINQIAKELNKAYPHINAKVNNLIKEGVLKKAIVGKSCLCSLNLENEKALALLILQNAEKKEKALSKIKNKDNFFEELSKIKAEFKVHTIALHNNSLVFVLDYLHDREAIKNLYKEIKQFNLLFFDRESFIDYLLENPSGISGFVVLYSYEKYFECLNEVKKDMALKILFGKKGKHGN